MRFTLLLTLLLSIHFSDFSQTNVLISDGNVNTCLGSLFDSGGQGGTGYSDNENYTLTICPDNPNDIITLDFLNFALSNVSTANPNNADNLTIYDGNTIAATTLGTYSGNQLQGITVSCTSLNTSGCLTLVFTSNDQGTGVFAAGITCATPCQRPVVSMVTPTVPQNPHRICDGDLVAFDGSSSTAAAGFNIVQYIWNWGDGMIDTTTTPQTNHTFNSGSGEYPVNLYVIDDNDCINSNLETINVQVGTEPDMSFISNDTLLCIGETACLDAYPQLMPTTWAALPSADLGGATYLPDDVGSCFESGLDFGIFTPGQTLNNINDLTSICVNMEHSFMGDLVASIICPNGQSVILHQQNGGGTYLGDPFDVDDSLQPGNCWQYCWSPIATNGTWEDNAEFGATPNVMPAPNTGSNSLIPGTYESLNPLNGLVGCPLNGTWTLEFCDLWGSDDGFICDWEIAFDPSIYPPLTTFTPVVGNDSDSSFWSASGPANTFISSSSADMNQICLTPTQTGTFDYDYTIIDNHGCSYDTTIILTVGNGATIDAGQDQTICPGDFQVDAITTGGIDPAPTCEYSINMFDTFADGWNGFSIDVFINGVLQDNHTLANGGTGTSTFPVADGDAIAFNVIAGTFDSEVSYEIVDCSGNVLFQAGANYSGAAPMTGNNIWLGTGVSNALPQYSYSWTPTTGVNSANEEDPLITTLVTQTYTVEVWETTHPNCVNSDDITLTVVNNGYAGNDTTLFYCQDDAIVDLFTTIPNNPDAGGVWYEVNNSNPTTSTFDPSTANSTDFLYVVGTGGCSDTSEISVNVAEPFVLNLTTDTIICENGTATISVTPSGGLGSPYTETWDQGVLGNGPHNVQPGIQTTYTVFITDNYGCVSQTEQVDINYNPPILITVTNTDSICPDDIATLNVTALGGNNNYNYNWTNAGAFVSANSQVDVSPAVSTEYCIEVSDGCETSPVQSCVNVEIFPMPILSFESDIINGCHPIDVTFTNTSNSNLIQDIEWIFGNGNVATGPGPITNTYLTPICHTVSINVTTVNTCEISMVQTDMICPDEYPVANFEFNPEITDLNQTTVSFEETASADAVSFNWVFGDNSEIDPSFENNPTVVFPITNPDNYDITLTVTNAAGCSHDTTYTLIINDVFSLYVPNTFSPNGDGVNDFFFPKGAAIDSEGYEMLIFDRDGHIIFETTEITDFWDGKAKTGEQIPQGVYVWKISALDQYSGEDKLFMGHVNLIR